mmetsp:Transcript_8939/g.20786  ORF Transcript_8939/g.20786 Transcript_8939/m.20786 type:complete len:140 (-) Transcript_8939:99-518(-)
MSKEQQTSFLRQAVILRKNLTAWEATLRSQYGEDWPSMLGRLNAAFNQAGNLDSQIEDAAEHAVYVPKKCTVNAQDISFFLSTRLVTATGDDKTDRKCADENDPESQNFGGEQPSNRLRRYESEAKDIANEFENSLVRF